MKELSANTFKEIIVTENKGVLTLRFNRPQKKNAMNLALVNEVIDVFDAITHRPDIRVVVIEGCDGHFCSGGDISDMHLSSLAPEQRERTIWQFNRRFGEMITKVDNATAVVIAVLEGAVLGGGFGVACVADLTLANQSAYFALPETSLGLIPAQIAPFVAKRIGLHQAKRLALTGEQLSFSQAQALGLVHYAFEEAHREREKTALIEKVKHCAPSANALTKQLLRDIEHQPLTALLDHAATLFVQSLTSKEGTEGTRAFVEKRTPYWCK